MASISGKDTKPEISIRSYLFKHGFRFRKNVTTLPGKPDIVLPKYKIIIFVHGCFWHGHTCKRAARPTSNIKFWETKIQTTTIRDKKVKNELKKLGWQVITIWDCELKSKKRFDNSMNKLLKKLNATEAIRSSHTHWLAAQSSPQAKASQRVCLPNPEKKFSKMPHARQKRKGQSAYNETLEKAATKTQHCIKHIGQTT